MKATVKATATNVRKIETIEEDFNGNPYRSMLIFGYPEDIPMDINMYYIHLFWEYRNFGTMKFMVLKSIPKLVITRSLHRPGFTVR